MPPSYYYTSLPNFASRDAIIGSLNPGGNGGSIDILEIGKKTIG